MAALATRASIQAAGDFYLCPLSALQVSADQLARELAALRESAQPLLTVERRGADGQTHCIAQGYECSQTITAQLEAGPSTWTERRMLVRSLVAARAAETALRARLGQEYEFMRAPSGHLGICLSQDRLAILDFVANFTLNKESRLPIK